MGVLGGDEATEESCLGWGRGWKVGRSEADLDKDKTLRDGRKLGIRRDRDDVSPTVSRSVSNAAVLNDITGKMRFYRSFLKSRWCSQSRANVG